MGFVPYRHAVSYDIRTLSRTVAWLDQVIRHIDGFVVASLDNLAVEGKGRKRYLKADDVTFAEGGIGGHEVFGTGHVDFLPRDITQPIAIGVEANRGVKTGFATGPAYADVASALFLVVRGVVRWFDPTEDFAFPVPASFAHADVCAGHTEPLFSADASAGKVEENVWRDIFEVDARTVGFCF